jgi:hypothetical protein
MQLIVVAVSSEVGSKSFSLTVTYIPTFKVCQTAWNTEMKASKHRLNAEIRATSRFFVLTLWQAKAAATVKGPEQ